MGRFSVSQLIIFVLFCVLVFGDVPKMISNLKVFLKKRKFISIKKKTGKKGLEPLTFGFGNHCSTN